MGGYTWTTVPITWRNRRTGMAKLKLRDVGSRYLFIVAYVWLEKILSRGDYARLPGIEDEQGTLHTAIDRIDSKLIRQIS